MRWLRIEGRILSDDIPRPFPTATTGDSTELSRGADSSDAVFPCSTESCDWEPFYEF
jgi:hypothetical protein